MSTVATTADAVSEAPEAVDLDSVRTLAAFAGASVSETRDGRTGEEKVKALSEAGEKTAEVDSKKTIYELAAGSKAEVAAAIQMLAYVFERHFNIDFIREAPLGEVTSGIAGQRAAMSGTREKPHEVDDRIVPPGVNNATDEVLPPNIPVGEPIPGTDERPGVGDSGPVADGADEGAPAEPTGTVEDEGTATDAAALPEGNPGVNWTIAQIHAKAEQDGLEGVRKSGSKEEILTSYRAAARKKSS